MIVVPIPSMDWAIQDRIFVSSTGLDNFVNTYHLHLSVGLITTGLLSSIGVSVDDRTTRVYASWNIQWNDGDDFFIQSALGLGLVQVQYFIIQNHSMSRPSRSFVCPMDCGIIAGVPVGTFHSSFQPHVLWLWFACGLRVLFHIQRPRNASSTNKSSRWIPARPRKVE